jgi:IS30 family transposase
MAKHFTFEQRTILHRLNKQGMPKAEIARLMGRDRSTIYRELRRNTGGCGYRPKQAQRLAQERRQACRRSFKMGDPHVHDYVREKLEKRWSPDQIAGRLRRDFPRQPQRWLSRQTIYTWIYNHAPEWCEWLRRGGRPPEKRGKLSGCVSIRGRGDVINHRRRYGDWEGDTIVGQGRRSALLTMTERKSGYLRMGRIDNMKSATAMRAARRRMKDLPPPLRRSATLDNGKEFAEHEKLTRHLGLEVYFAMPFASWQRGTSENTNGLIRQFFPKGTNFTEVSHQEVARVENLINERPRRRLNYRTPREVLSNRLCCI